MKGTLFFTVRGNDKARKNALIDKIKRVQQEYKELQKGTVNLDAFCDFKNKLDEIENDSFYKLLPTNFNRSIHHMREELEQQFPIAAEPGDLPLVTIQHPSNDDLANMHGMFAGESEDQATRIGHMTLKIHESLDNLAPNLLCDTQQVSLAAYWLDLFAAIRQGNENLANRLLMAIPEEDQILNALIGIYKKQYLKQIIKHTIEAVDSARGTKRINNNDIVYTPGTFELIIRDLATTLFCPTPICISFGLPTHHATGSRASGFCHLNKTAVLIDFLHKTSSEPLSFFIIGTDVNRDNGLCQILRTKQTEAPVCHIDIFDSRVYPQQNFNDITMEFTQSPDIAPNMALWKEGNYEYMAIDLQSGRTNATELHPALLYSISTLKNQVEHAKTNQQKIMLLLPSGWDSHVHETAPCGKLLYGHTMMSDEETQLCRFSDQDLSTFYHEIFSIYLENPEVFKGIYWGLEGGYNRAMYEQQISLLAESIITHFYSQDLTPSLRR
ncbi:MAG: acetylpolyamine aminohydrolase [Legionella sp.]|nr:MAG: acetylpolyamine aminohydrolase [Legionella sp.]